MMKLTEKQLTILKWIADYITENKIAPSYAEIGKGTGTHPQNIGSVVTALSNKGYVKARYNTKRSIVITDKGREILEGK